MVEDFSCVIFRLKLSPFIYFIFMLDSYDDDANRGVKFCPSVRGRRVHPRRTNEPRSITKLGP